jgi:hypothetical protein
MQPMAVPPKILTPGSVVDMPIVNSRTSPVGTLLLVVFMESVSVLPFTTWVPDFAV